MNPELLLLECARRSIWSGLLLPGGLERATGRIKDPLHETVSHRVWGRPRVTTGPAWVRGVPGTHRRGSSHGSV